MPEFVVRSPRIFLMGVCALVVGIALWIVTAPPQQFPAGSTVSVIQGESVSTIAKKLEGSNVVKHGYILEFVLRITGQSGNINAGQYLFEAPINTLQLAYHLSTGNYGLELIKVTFPEGETVREMAIRITKVFPNISLNDFTALAIAHEGYLFPDTYLFPPSATAELIIQTMRDTFTKKINTVSDDIRASGHSLSDVITMASLLEKEARTTEVRQIVSGILWNRIQAGMPLQVDAVFGYIFKRDTYSPSFDDLKVDSPYNTYKYKGLPPAPIANPGMDSIYAALHPAKTKFFYYLTDKNGVMHYATTFAGHQLNRARYLQ